MFLFTLIYSTYFILNMFNMQVHIKQWQDSQSNEGGQLLVELETL